MTLTYCEIIRFHETLIFVYFVVQLNNEQTIVWKCMQLMFLNPRNWNAFFPENHGISYPRRVDIDSYLLLRLCVSNDRKRHTFMAIHFSLIFILLMLQLDPLLSNHYFTATFQMYESKLRLEKRFTG